MLVCQLRYFSNNSTPFSNNDLLIIHAAMGRPSTTTKKRKRFKQKVRRKLFSQEHEHTSVTCGSDHEVCNESHSELETLETSNQESNLWATIECATKRAVLLMSIRHLTAV